MIIKAHSVLVHKTIIGQFPELGSLFAYLASNLSSIVTNAKGPAELLETIDGLAASALGGQYLRTCFIDLDHEELTPENLPPDVCLMLIENGKYTVH
jgi:hypothetical protein